MGIYHDDEGDELAAARAEIARLQASVAELEAGMVNFDRWGLQLLEGLGDFVRSALEAGGPVMTKWRCNFPDLGDQAVLHLWATTAHDADPLKRIDELRVALDNSRALNTGLTAELRAKSNKAPNTLSDAPSHLCTPSAAEGQPTPGEDTP